MPYWLDLFTGTTWQEFLDAGANISGFRLAQAEQADRIKPGHVLICYVTGVKRFVGALYVLEKSDDKRRIWKDDAFPVRFKVKPIVLLAPEAGIPLDDLEGKVDFFATSTERGGYKGFFRRSPSQFKREADGDLILRMLKEAKENPIIREVDPKQLARKPTYLAVRREGRKEIRARVTVPDADKTELTEPTRTFDLKEESPHTEMQFDLLSIGAEMGHEVWVARNDRSRQWAGKRLGDLHGVVNELPTQFNEATTRTIELIDVLWLKGNSIVAAFEVEHTTSVYSGLLRMSDLLSLQPNLDINLYIVAPDDRRSKVQQEILRPTFALREKPLPDVCGFIPFSKLRATVAGIRKLNLARSLQASFLDTISEYFDAED